jgi:hypothetical protein
MSNQISLTRIVIFDGVKRFARDFPNEAAGRRGPKMAMKFSRRADP